MTMTEQLPNFVTVAEVARLYGCSRQTIRRRIHDGTLTAYRPGSRAIRLDLGQVQAAFQLPSAGSAACEVLAPRPTESA